MRAIGMPCLRILLAAWLALSASAAGARSGFVELAAPGDGTTDATAAVAEAVAQAQRSGEWLYFPVGTYVTTASIPDFHAVRKFGPGIIKRGDNLFHVSPESAVTNHLFVDPSGSDANDGLSRGEPLATLAASASVIEDTAPSNHWDVHLAAGTYTGIVGFPTNPRAGKTVDVIGPKLSQEPGQSIILRYPEGGRVGEFGNGHTIAQSGSGAACTSTAVYVGAIVCDWVSGTFTSTGTLEDGTSGATAPTDSFSLVPRAVIDGSANPGEIAVRARGGAAVRLYDLKIVNFSEGSGVLAAAGGQLTAYNLHAWNNRKVATTSYGGRIDLVGGDWDCRDGEGNVIARSIGLQSLFNGTHSLTQPSAAEALVIYHCDRGLLFHEGAQGHIDNVKVFDSTTAGMNLKRGAGAVNTKTITLLRNAIGILLENNQWFDNGVNFTSGAAGGDGNDNNRINVKSLGDSPELVFLTAHNAARTMRMISTSAAAAHTGTTDRVDLWTSVTIPDWVISEPGSHHFARVTVNFEAQLSGPAAIDAVIDNGAPDRMGAIEIPAGTTDGRIVLEIRHESASHESAMLSAIGKPSFATADFEAADSAGGSLKNTEFVLGLRAALSNASDSITFHNIVFEATYGG